MGSSGAVAREDRGPSRQGEGGPVRRRGVVGQGLALWVTAPPGQLFKGKFYYCEGADTRNISTKAECRAAHYRWVRRKYNFDNLGQVGGAGAGRAGLAGDSPSAALIWRAGAAGSQPTS